MKTGYILAGALALGAAAAAYQFTSPGSVDAQTPAAAGAPLAQVKLPETLSANAQIGKNGYDAVCADCHGENADGRKGMGPPLVHKIYEPSHHGDESFQLAVQRGVRAHHWPFGNMPAQQGLTRADVSAIVAYVREMQRANGIN
ncbi:c-type cytochrome [Antarctobacter heliothermus]|uniref:Cytochrome c n=1 Tax=Antarctobacter heliothermus TaxID=74033 RepID=A0A239F462_9RHOB|nr:cytochrome c [Antarctobacter heliothermus]SNS51679.1 Cytochrome c [Antarctobacter heliothermus]